MNNNNNITIIGIISDCIEYSHENNGEIFYKTYITTKRKCETNDIIPILISERLFRTISNLVNNKVKITGEIRSFNKKDCNNTKLIISIFVNYFEIITESIEDVNEVELNGYICSVPNERDTPGGRHIADTIVAVNRQYGKSDYIPCIFWGRNATYVSNLNIGENILVKGRLQSRQYNKRNSCGREEKMITYEVSVSSINIIR